MTFTEIVGHRSLLTIIARAVARGSIPPSLLFVGPEGIGKRQAASALSQALNCVSPIQQSISASSSSLVFEMDACGRCHSCQRIARNTFTDVITVEPGESRSITVEQVREVISQVAYRPFEGQRRVVIIDDAEQLVPAAQNALLKTLEEPSESSQFILVTSRQDMLLATVRSRCQQLSFGQLGVDEVFDLLHRVHGWNERVAHIASASAGGSIGRALQLASGELAASRDGAVSLLEIVASARDATMRLEGAKMFLSNKKSGRTPALIRQELIRRMRALSSLLRDVELVAAGADQRWLANADLKEGITSLAKNFGGTRGLDAFAAVDRAIEATDQNVNPKVIADWLACEL
jgi:DNA polymerase-3 subunit delta'